MIRLFHMHKWVDYERTYMPPTGGSANGLPHSMYLMMAFGLTNLTQRCEKCGAKRIIKYAGR